jgi:hypothetical protein
MAVADVAVHLFAHPRPVVTAAEKFQGLGASRVSGRGGVVVVAEKFQAKGVVVRDV